MVIAFQKAVFDWDGAGIHTFVGVQNIKCERIAHQTNYAQNRQ